MVERLLKYVNKSNKKKGSMVMNINKIISLGFLIMLIGAQCWGVRQLTAQEGEELVEQLVDYHNGIVRQNKIGFINKLENDRQKNGLPELSEEEKHKNTM